MRCGLVAGRLLVVVLATTAGGTAPAAEADPLGHFEKEIRPLLVERCLGCHAGAGAEAGLRLDSRSGFLDGGASGPAVVPGDAAAGTLLRAVSYVDAPRMPPDGRLPESAIRALATWVAAGAPMPAGTLSDAPASPPAGAWAPTDAHRSWWAFQPLGDPMPPAIDGAVARDDLDRFVVATLRGRGLEPVEEADRGTWLRRVTFDLTGLPPTPEAVADFLADGAPEARERVVDRLLASPAHGERMARHWLDVVRYADYHAGDPAGRNPVCEPMEAWRYRDWVVDAFNRDLPFDTFVEMQVCGDLLPAPDGAAVHADGLVATTFLVNGAWDRGDADKEKMVSDMVDDQIDAVGKAFLGLTLGCARCHDHKFDPVSQADYYALAGIFYSTRMLEELGTKGGEITLQRRMLVPDEVAAARRRGMALGAHLDASLAALDRGGAPPDDPERVAILAEKSRVAAATPAEPPRALAVSEGGVPGGLFPGIQDVPIHVRGSYARLGEVVPRRMPAFFSSSDARRIESGSGRRELARFLVDPANPLLDRVIVNRVWQWHFGRGFVPTAGNFGLTSEPPSHPDLLDFLARAFRAGGRSLKGLHRRIVLSATYGRSSRAGTTLREADPENVLLGRFPARRLEAEAIRDAMLAAAGTLDVAGGGPATHDVALPRRSLYLQTARWDRSGFATLFDAANPDAPVEKRDTSTVAPQALWLMNNPFVLGVSGDLAARLARDVPDGVPDAPARRVERAWHLLYGRAPRSDETATALSLVGGRGDDGWVDLTHVLLCATEFLHVD